MVFDGEDLMFDVENFQGHKRMTDTPCDSLHRPTGWAYLPPLLLEDIFAMLTHKQRHACSQVCFAWYQAFYSPRLWKSLHVTPMTFTSKRVNLYTPEEREVDKFKVFRCLQQVGQYFRRIAIDRNSNYHNVSRVIQVIGSLLDKYSDEFPLCSLRRFDFEFACETKDLWSSDFVVIGTGGGMLREMNYTLAHLSNIEHLSFNHLCMSNQDAIGFLDEFVLNNRKSLRYLEIRNLTRMRKPLTNAALFPHLQTFVTSPLHVSDTVVMMLAERTQLRHLVLVQDRYTGPCQPIMPQTWYEVKLIAPKLKVRLEVRDRTFEDVMIQPMAPVDSVIYRNPSGQISTHTVQQLCDEYNAHLEVYGKTYVHRRHRSRRFHDRADSALVTLARECRKLHTLIVSERVSTSTLLIIARESKRLRHLYVRRNAVILKCDWLKAVRWSDDFYAWLRGASHDYAQFERQMSVMLRQDWKMLSDREFKALDARFQFE